MLASCYWGSGTEWCTATRDELDNQYHDYADFSDLHIFINKQTNEKYQACFGQNIFMDAKDEDIWEPALKTIGANENVKNFVKDYCEEYGLDWAHYWYDIIGETKNALHITKRHPNRQGQRRRCRDSFGRARRVRIYLGGRCCLLVVSRAFALPRMR
jgi:hypothetical protein